jgi:hypothetical protein
MGFHNYGVRVALLLIVVLGVGIAVAVSLTGPTPRIQPDPVLPTIKTEASPQSGGRTASSPRPPCALLQTCAPL